MIRLAKCILPILLLKFSVASGQYQTSLDTLFILPDSTRPFTIGNFYDLILQYHPVAKQANLLSDVAAQEIRLARGNFDPKLEASFLAKHYNDKEYYSIFNGSVKFPTVFPINPTIGIDQNEGDYLNPERYIGEEFDYRQFYAGVSIPIGQGLFTDERRAALRQAELFKEMTEADQVKMINKLMLDAAKDYWQWYYAYYNYRLLQRSVKIAEEIFRRVNINHQYGEAATIDTVQAKITLQERLIEQQEALLDFQNSGIRVSTFLWDSLSRPLSLDLTWVPVLESGTKALPSSVLTELIDQARTNHPDLQKLGIKLRQLEVERKLAAEYLKPRLDLNYYFLNQPLDPEGSASLQFGDNYKLGVDFSFPIFLRKERAKLALTKLKLSNTNFERNLAERQIVNELNSAYNQLTNIQSIMQAQRDLVQSYERLLDAELLNLQEGESDLFKINLQQEKLIQTQTKWLKLVAENEKQKAYLYWAAGVRNLGGLN